MALSKNTPIKEVLGDFEDLPLYQAIHAYEGSMIFSRVDGYATIAAGGLLFRGHADAEADNSAGLDGAKTVRVRRGNYRAQVALASVAITDQGKDVYASDDGTLTLTATSNSRVGKVVRYVTTNTCIVEFQAGVGSDLPDHGHTAGTDGGKLTSPLITTGIKDNNGNEIITLGAITDAVNELKVSNGGTGVGPVLEAVGETNVSITIKPKGTGVLNLCSVATQKLAAFGVAGVVQQNHIADPAGGATADAEARTAINAILAALEGYGLLKTS